MSAAHAVPEVPTALFLGGFDPSSGAGILRDALVASDLGVYPMAVPLAETAQNGVECSEIAPPGFSPMKRLESLRIHLTGSWGAKLSMFHDLPLLENVLNRIQELRPAAAIWDPVGGPTNGPRLHGPGATKSALALLNSDTWLVSPNIPEARALADMPDGPLETVAKKIMDMGAQSVWIRGGHADSKTTVQDLWADGSGLEWLAPHGRLNGDPRGTGCTATSAWLSYRLKGLGAASAAEAAINYVRKAWDHLCRPGGAGRASFPPSVTI
jgi:hydroxymethylpyrimidine kinase/phosphomethylpyrimidine kinase